MNKRKQPPDLMATIASELDKHGCICSLEVAAMLGVHPGEAYRLLWEQPEMEPVPGRDLYWRRKHVA
jgi:predicted urease superfamily metal-dependent hydrolase